MYLRVITCLVSIRMDGTNRKGSKNEWHKSTRQYDLIKMSLIDKKCYGKKNTLIMRLPNQIKDPTGQPVQQLF